MLSCLRRGPNFYRDLVRLSIPMILQNLITNSLGLVDTFMVGLLGELPLAGVTLANIPIFVVQLIVFGIQSGSSVLISQFWGKKDTGTINQVIGIGLYVAGAISLAFALILFFFPMGFMSLFTNNPEVAAVAARYGRIVGFSYIFNSLTQVYIGAHRSMENPRLGLYILSVSMCVNTFLNWVFIFGNLGAPAMGVEGAAIATLAARVVEFIIMMVYALVNKRFPLRLRLLLRPKGALVHSFVRYSSPVVLNETLWGLGSSMFPTIMGYMDGSAEILAAYAISGNIEKVCTVAIFAVAGAAAIIVGREIGAGRANTVYEVGGALTIVALMVGFVMGAVLLGLTYWVLAPYLYPIFGLSDTARSISIMMLTVLFVSLPVRSFNVTSIVGVLRGGGDVRAATFIDTVPLWVVAIPLSALCALVFKMDILWVYLAATAEQVVKLVLGLSRYRSGLWIHDVTRVSYQKEKEG